MYLNFIFIYYVFLKDGHFRIFKVIVCNIKIHSDSKLFQGERFNIWTKQLQFLSYAYFVTKNDCMLEIMLAIIFNLQDKILMKQMLHHITGYY